MWPLAVLVLLTATLVPLAWLLSTAYVLLPLRLGRVPWGWPRCSGSPSCCGPGR